MSKFKIIQLILRRKDLSHATKNIGTMLVSHADDSLISWPGIKLLMDEVGAARETVIQGILQLESAGILEVERRGTGKSNQYHITPETVKPESQSGLKTRPVYSLDQPVYSLDQKRSKKWTVLEQEQEGNIGETEAILTFPTKCKAKTWNLTKGKIQEYQETYPSLDIMFQCRKALQWCRDNPTKQKTARGMPRFMNGWMNRAADKVTATKPTDRLTEFINDENGAL